MNDIIDLTLEALARMEITPEHFEENLVIFFYGKWPCLGLKCRPYTVKMMVYLYSSDNLAWPSDSFQLSVCKSISSYKDEYEEYLYDDDGQLLVVTYITPPYSGQPVRLMQLQIERFFNTSVTRAMSYIEGITELRDALGQYTHWGWITPQEKISEKGCWTDVRQYTEGLVAVADKKGRYGFLDADAEVAIPCKWAYAQPFSEELAAVENYDGRYGFIDRTGKIAIPCEWHRAEWFSEGLAAVMSANGEWGFIDTEARLVIPCEWGEVDEFRNGHTQVWDNDGNTYAIDRNGNIIEY